MVGGIGSALALAVVAVLYLPELGRHALGPLAARRAIELKAPGEEIVVFKPRVEEVFFYLPRGVVTCRDAGCVASLVGEGTAVLGVGRRDDVELLAEEWRGARVVEVDRVVGVDVGRAGLGEQVLFRVDPLRPRPRAAAGASVDSRRAGP
ncbi:MAG TPA: hypothetical protein PLV66_09520 [Thermoanaerobaculales bacterium]|nr:hypothetical protein [Thermoanaerobaculales bacterium]